MRWIDIGKARAATGGVEGITFGSEDGAVIVATVATADGKPDPGKWAVWDGKKIGRLLIEGVTYKSAGAAMRAAEVWRESAVVSGLMSVASAIDRVAFVVRQIAGAYAGRVVASMGPSAFDGGAEPVVVNVGPHAVPRADAPERRKTPPQRRRAE